MRRPPFCLCMQTEAGINDLGFRSLARKVGHSVNSFPAGGQYIV